MWFQAHCQKATVKEMSDPGELGIGGILQLGTAFWASKVLLSAVELDVFTVLAEVGSSDADTVARRVGLHKRSASDFLDALVALGMLRRLDGTYECTASTAMYLDRNKPTYVGGFLEMANSRIYQQWGSLTDALRTGRPQYQGSSEDDIFTALYGDEAGVREIAEAMGSAAALMGGGLAPTIFVGSLREFRRHRRIRWWSGRPDRLEPRPSERPML
jgi:hypothetical protein